MKIQGIFIFSFLLFFSSHDMYSQFIIYDDLIRLKIVEPSELYYNYALSGSEKVELNNAVTDQAAFDHILQYCTETGWPANMNSLEWRTKHSSFFKSLVVFQVAELSDFLSLVIVPKELNADICKKAKVELTNDIYLIFPSVAVRR